MCWNVKELDAVNELTSLFAPRSDAGNSLVIDIRSSAKIRNLASLRYLLHRDSRSTDYEQVQLQAISLLPLTNVITPYYGHCASNYNLFELGIALINLLCCTPRS